MSERLQAFERLHEEFDVLVVGGGATGLGIALDAVTRGYRTALVEAGDFAQATSSRATKLVHGGVRYLASGQMHLVYEALHERKVMQKIAPHLVHPLAFVTPVYKWADLPFYGAGLKLYDLLSGRASMGPTHVLGRQKTVERIPNIEQKDLKGSVIYHDGQFDDARLALMIARTAEDYGAVVMNYAKCIELVRAKSRVCGAVVQDLELGRSVFVRAAVVINATGIFSDSMRQLDQPGAAPLLSVSRGTHIVVSPDVLGAASAIMVPKTDDGRVIFAIPWLGKVVIGTTDIPVSAAKMEPGYEHGEIAYLLQHINPYLSRKISQEDILSVFSGLRPLVTGKEATTSKLSREHHIDASASGMITVAGGKWTTYRRMAQDTLDFAVKRNLLRPMKACVTMKLPLHGTEAGATATGPLARYGSDAGKVAALAEADPELGELLDPSLPFTAAEVVFAVREEMARTVEDVLARRTRALILDAHAAMRAAPKVAAWMSKELGTDQAWIAQQVQAFLALASQNYAAVP